MTTLRDIRARDAEYDEYSSVLGKGVMYGEGDRRALLSILDRCVPYLKLASSIPLTVTERNGLDELLMELSDGR